MEGILDAGSRTSWWLKKMAQTLRERHPEVEEVRLCPAQSRQSQIPVVHFLLILSQTTIPIAERSHVYGVGSGFHLTDFVVNVMALTREEIDQEIEAGEPYIAYALRKSTPLYQ